MQKLLCGVHVPGVFGRTVGAEGEVGKGHEKSLWQALLEAPWQASWICSWNGQGLWGVRGMSLRGGLGLGPGAVHSEGFYWLTRVPELCFCPR